MIDVFLKITSNKAFASNIEEMVYDARLLWSFFEDPVIYKSRFQIQCQETGITWLGAGNGSSHMTDGLNLDTVASSDEGRHDKGGAFDMAQYKVFQRQANRLTEETMLLKSMSTYSMLLREQDSIFNDRQDLEALCTGFQRLPNLRRISILDLFGDPLDDPTFNCLWFYQQLKKAFKDTLMPVQWWIAEIEKEEHISLSNGDFPWDYRGITNLLTAIKKHAPQLRHLSIGCLNHKVSTAIFNRQELAQTLGKVASRLISLKMHCMMPDTMFKHVEYGLASDRVSATSEIFQEAKQLQSLSLTFDHDWLAGWTIILHGTRYSRLRELHLGSGIVETQCFRDIINAHRETLLDLRLHGLQIFDGGSWKELAEELGRHLRLHFLAIHCVGDTVEVSIRDPMYLDRHQILEIAISFMQQTPKGSITTSESERGMILAWNSKEVYPEFDLASICQDVSVYTLPGSGRIVPGTD